MHTNEQNRTVDGFFFPLQITRIHLNSAYGKPMRSAFIEFGDEEAMKAGLSGHAEVRYLYFIFLTSSDVSPNGNVVNRN